MGGGKRLFFDFFTWNKNREHSSTHFKILYINRLSMLLSLNSYNIGKSLSSLVGKNESPIKYLSTW